MTQENCLGKSYETVYYLRGRHGGKVVSVLTFYSDDSSSDRVDVYSFCAVIFLKRQKINKIRPMLKIVNIFGDPRIQIFKKSVLCLPSHLLQIYM